MEKIDVFPCSNGDPDIIISETIRFNELQLLRLWSKAFTIKMFSSYTTSIQIVIIELILIVQIERKNITLRPNAVPRSFDRLPSYLSNPSSGSRSSPSKRRRLVMERHDHDQKEWLDADLIGSYDALSRSASDHLADSFPLLLIKLCSDDIPMYGMQHIEDTYSVVIVTFVLKSY